MVTPAAGCAGATSFGDAAGPNLRAPAPKHDVPKHAMFPCHVPVSCFHAMFPGPFHALFRMSCFHAMNPCHVFHAAVGLSCFGKHAMLDLPCFFQKHAMNRKHALF